MLTKAAADASESACPVVTISVDEKPGIQAVASIAPDMSPVAGRYAEKPDGTMNMNMCDMGY